MNSTPQTSAAQPSLVQNPQWNGRSAISIEGIGKTYNTAKGPFEALKNVSFQIEQGEFFGLLGPNGAGKTTLISLLSGLAKPTSGRIQVLGHDVQINIRAGALPPPEDNGISYLKIPLNTL